MNTPDPRPSLRSRIGHGLRFWPVSHARGRTLAVCAVPLVALLAVAALAPLPMSLAQPGLTANVIGRNKSKPVITVSGADGRGRGDDDGQAADDDHRGDAARRRTSNCRMS